MPHRTLSDSGVSSHRRPILDSIDSPADLRALSESQLPEVASELRSFLIECVSKTGGHLAAGLGVVELTIGLHYVFDTPRDRLVWDVGHQAYPHKILTGRRDRMCTLRQKDGVSGFPRRGESEYDAFGVGHSSTSISAALGMALAAQQRGERRTVIAIIGDGALGAGMAFEALNHAGSMDVDLVVILNDNEMSISPPVGAISNHLARLLSGKLYTTVREGSKSALANMPQLRQLVGRWEEHVKGMVMPSTLFEELGFNYIGPVDGHDLDGLVRTLRNIKGMPGQRLLHIVTKKGRGFEPAEGQPMTYHGVTPFNRHTGELVAGKSKGASYTQIFGGWLCDAAAAGQAARRHHPGHVRGVWPHRLLQALPRPLLRRRHRRAARRDPCRWHGLRGAQAGRRHLFQLPATRLRSARP